MLLTESSISVQPSRVAVLKFIPMVNKKKQVDSSITINSNCIGFELLPFVHIGTDINRHSAKYRITHTVSHIILKILSGNIINFFFLISSFSCDFSFCVSAKRVERLSFFFPA